MRSCGWADGRCHCPEECERVGHCLVGVPRTKAELAAVDAEYDAVMRQLNPDLYQLAKENSRMTYTDPETGIVYWRDENGILRPRELTNAEGEITGYEQVAGWFPARVDGRLCDSE